MAILITAIFPYIPHTNVDKIHQVLLIMNRKLKTSRFRCNTHQTHLISMTPIHLITYVIFAHVSIPLESIRLLAYPNIANGQLCMLTQNNKNLAKANDLEITKKLLSI